MCGVTFEDGLSGTPGTPGYLFHGLLPMRRGHSGQSTLTHLRTSLLLCSQHERHLARMALSPTSFCKPAASKSALVRVRGSRPINSPASFSYGDGSNNGFGSDDNVGLYAAGPLRALCGEAALKSRPSRSERKLALGLEPALMDRFGFRSGKFNQIGGRSPLFCAPRYS